MKDSFPAEPADSVIARLTAKRKAQVVVDILKGMTKGAEVAGRHDLTGSEIGNCIWEGADTPNSFPARQQDVREKYEHKLVEVY